MPVGIDLKEFYLSVEWDILEVPARRNEEFYPGVVSAYIGKTTSFRSMYIGKNNFFRSICMYVHTLCMLAWYEDLFGSS